MTIYEPAQVWLWTLLVDDEYEPGMSGGRRSIQLPSFHDTEEGIKKEVEHRWATKVIAFRGKVELYCREDDPPLD